MFVLVCSKCWYVCGVSLLGVMLCLSVAVLEHLVSWWRCSVRNVGVFQVLVCSQCWCVDGVGLLVMVLCGVVGVLQVMVCARC